MAITPLDRDVLLRAIRSLPREEQITLARTILEQADQGLAASASPIESHDQTTWDALYGIASNGQEPPSDEQVQQWLDEHKMEKYGR